MKTVKMYVVEAGSEMAWIFANNEEEALETQDETLLYDKEGDHTIEALDLDKQVSLTLEGGTKVKLRVDEWIELFGLHGPIQAQELCTTAV